MSLSSVLNMDYVAFWNKTSLGQVTKPAERIGFTKSQVLEHCARTAITALTSMFVAKLFRLPQSYWAPITTIVITQSSLRTTLALSWQRFFGTALGALVGGAVATYFGPHLLVFGASV
ncbi:MAG: FUSC family protein, partial [Acidobacteria bacterium]|nr:FUSC family protein [Acidobacteriota bacterium]